MSVLWSDRFVLRLVKHCLEQKKFVDRVHLIKKLLDVINKALDGMEAEVAKECP